MQTGNNYEELHKPMQWVFDGSEKDFEENVFENIDQICDCLSLPKITVIERQRSIKADNFQIRPDILVRHEDGSMTVFEVKKINGKTPATSGHEQVAGIGQLLLYGNVLSALINAPVRLALIDNKINYRTFCCFGQYKLPITLLELQKDRLFVPYYGWDQE